MKSISLHTFVDASQSAYGAVAYVRTEYDDQTVSVILAAVKTKVAPLQSVPIPRLELMVAHLGSKLAHSIISEATAICRLFNNHLSKFCSLFNAIL